MSVWSMEISANPQNSPTMRHLDPVSRATSKWRMNDDGAELEQVVHTHRTSYRNGWPGGFDALILIFTSEYFHRSYSFTSATVQSYPTSISMLLNNDNR